MATHSISKYRLTKSIHKEQLKLLKQQLSDPNPQDYQTNISQHNLTNLTQQLQNPNSQTKSFNSIFDEIKQQPPLTCNKYSAYFTKTFDQSLTKILRELSYPNQQEKTERIQSKRKLTKPINNANEATIKEDSKF
ncbi:unnamed protein product (macronuclear) [Paramecium tetraurelia]|uniref:Uncharacterized protein n=1 Tax=Paramecium tetraurelia TaxID=5888 RepID=A0D951_PARTE|nr:uncharacterized protein GSPATT00014514001 [Paramecium tetraurelia]CAK79568.1 unnamed protein product [Paramecium tetraurelia]|eukprot:XP_001446965.1 hypothetical protein (macronuclear) [Paramecium tetraurelia strain d4-2]